MSTTERGPFITFEGMDGSGKTTQLRRLAEALRRQGREVVETVEPGGTRIGHQIRRILLDPANQEMRPATELLLYFAARAQNVEELIRPALAAGKIVLCDRFTDSTWAYQGVARGLGVDVVIELDRISCRGLVPDLTLCFDIDMETSLARAEARNRDRGSDRMDDQADDFHSRVRGAYRRLAAEQPRRVRVIDGAPPVDAVAEAVWKSVTEFLDKQV